MIMKMRGDKCHPGRGKRVKIPLLPNNVGKKSVNEVGPKQGHDTFLNLFGFFLWPEDCENKLNKSLNFTEMSTYLTAYVNC